MAAINYFWRRHEGIVRKECHRFLRRFGGVFDELMSDAYLGFAKCLDNWIPERGAFSTLLVLCVRQALIDQHRRRMPRKPEVPLRDEVGIADSRKRSVWEKLGADSASICGIVLSLPRKDKKRVFAERLVELGLSGESISRSIREIKEVLG